MADNATQVLTSRQPARAGTDCAAVSDRAPLLRVDGVHKSFGGIQALRDVSLEVRPNEICGLIGPNGAGKTTLFNCVSRVYTPDAGSIRFGDRDITTLPCDRIVELGIARTFQNLGLIGALSVMDNVLLGAHHLLQPSFLRSALRLPSTSHAEERARGRAREMIDWLKLNDVAHETVDALPFGTLKRIELARALMCQPSLLLLDEPASGLTHSEVDDLAALIVDMRSRFGISVLLVEHHMRMVMRISDRVIVLEYGAKIAEGEPEDVQNDSRVIEAYLGGRR